MSGCACFLLQRRRCRSVPSDELSTDRQRFDDRLDDRPPMRGRPLARILAVAPAPGNPASAVAAANGCRRSLSGPMSAGGRFERGLGREGNRSRPRREVRPTMPVEPVRYVALGDSYTIGTSVAEPERWPNQLIERLG